MLWFEHEIVMRMDNALKGTSTRLDIGTIKVERKIIQMIEKSVS